MNWSEDYINKIICGDCLGVMKGMPDECVDLVVTDPFYGSGGRDGAVHLSNDAIVNNRMSAESFIWFVRNYAKSLYRLSKADSHAYVFSDWRKYKDVQISFEISGWELRSLIVWNKKNGMGEFWRSCHEFILFFAKRNPRKLTHGGCMNVITCLPVRGNKNHPVEKPVELLVQLIEASSGKEDIAFDPFIGSGTTGIASILTGRNYIGIEIDPDYCEIARKRVAQAQEQPDLFKKREEVKQEKLL